MTCLITMVIRNYFYRSVCTFRFRLKSCFFCQRHWNVIGYKQSQLHLSMALLFRVHGFFSLLVCHYNTTTFVGEILSSKYTLTFTIGGVGDIFCSYYVIAIYLDVYLGKKAIFRSYYVIAINLDVNYWMR